MKKERKDKKLGESFAQKIFFTTFAPANQNIRGVAQSGSAPGLGPGGRRFESCRPDQS